MLCSADMRASRLAVPDCKHAGVSYTLIRKKFQPHSIVRRCRCEPWGGSKQACEAHCMAFLVILPACNADSALRYRWYHVIL